jgi:hypothetical protein
LQKKVPAFLRFGFELKNSVGLCHLDWCNALAKAETHGNPIGFCRIPIPHPALSAIRVVRFRTPLAKTEQTTKREKGIENRE